MPHVAYKWRVAAVISVGLFLSLLDNTIVSVALPVMRRAFSTDLNTITWVGGGYFLAEAASISIAGYLCDRHGTRRTFLSSMALFVVASAMCMAAPTEVVLIVTRVIQGAGAGVMFLTAYAIAYRTFPPVERARATAIIGFPVVLAPAFGPAIGGYLTTTVSWRAIFAINLPLGLAALLMGWFLLHGRAEDADMDQEVDLQPQRFDAAGFLLTVLASTLLVAGLTEAGVRGWTDPLVVSLLLVGTLLIVPLVVLELRVHRPVLDVRLFRNNTIALATLLLCPFTGLYYGGVYLIPYFFEQVRGYPAITAGEILVPQGLASAIGMAVAGALYNRLGPRILTITGAAALAVSMWALTGVSPQTSGASVQPWLILRGLGLAFAIQPPQNLALSVLARSSLARASSLLNVIQQVAGAAGLAILAAYLTAEVAGQSAGCRERAAVDCVQRHAVASGLDHTFIAMTAAYAVCIVGACFLGRDPSLRPSMTQATETPVTHVEV